MGDLVTLVWSSLKREPVVKTAPDDDSSEVLIAELHVHLFVFMFAQEQVLSGAIEWSGSLLHIYSCITQ